MTVRKVLRIPAQAGAGSAGALRPANATDASGIHRLITRYQAAGRLLPRADDEIARHADRFLVITDGDDVLGCAELAPLSPHVAEVRSLVVDQTARGLGFGRSLIEALTEEAAQAGFTTVCAFTHDPSYFVRLGYSLVPHAWLPAKIAVDCAGCTLFRQCGQSAVQLRLEPRASRRRAA